MQVHTEHKTQWIHYMIWLLVFLLIFLALGGLYGGITMLIDPTGKILQMDEILQHLPVSDYVLPGLFLSIMMGLFPIILAFGLIKQPNWWWVNSIADWSRHYWAWTGSIALGIGLLIWLVIQGFLFGFHWPIQYVTLGNGILILIVALIPNLRKHYRHWCRQQSREKSLTDTEINGVVSVWVGIGSEQNRWTPDHRLREVAIKLVLAYFKWLTSGHCRKRFARRKAARLQDFSISCHHLRWVITGLTKRATCCTLRHSLGHKWRCIPTSQGIDALRCAYHDGFRITRMAMNVFTLTHYKYYKYTKFINV